MYDTDTYLRCLGLASEPVRRAGPSLDTLVLLHERHMRALPFSSTGSFAVPRRAGAVVEVVDLDLDAAFGPVVVAGGGGGCVHLNRLFLRLLRDLGFEAGLLAGTTIEGAEAYGVEIEHMLLFARAGGDTWLVDVGYAGPSFLAPLRLGETGEQVRHGCRYHLEPEGDGLVLRRRPRLGRWRTVYRVSPEPRELPEWRPFEKAANALLTAPPDPDGPGLWSRATADGQIVLKGLRLLTVRGGIEKTRTLTDEEWPAVRDRILAPAVPPSTEQERHAP
ncbi:arylamine N-acetyltransferase [Actinoplanes sp. N902-109]|uniref:arylamine N-acetyltransferase n=1 Tax=Actinoplanes sp. (strain N902-109) TaxID=649831 RepID=UPI00032948C0|nr:arylamine N-acetyltransferase [Actinoplanes sp. N902-109]AGL19226.1 putative amide synthase [Actinoplanes sp. N902-109]